jgi:hypothetical protein
VETALVIDASQSMGDGCNGSFSNPGCPIFEAREAADDFVTILLNSGFSSSEIAYAPYRDCYTPPHASNACVPSLNIPNNGNCPGAPSSWVVCLSDDEALLKGRINNTVPESATNICMGLYMAEQLLIDPGPGQSTDNSKRRFAVLLSDGENFYSDGSNPPSACAPTGGGDTSRRLDERTWEQAKELKAEDPSVEIYVIGFNVDGNENGAVYNEAQCDAQIGGSENSRRLLKCIASSSDGTNDHYYEVDFASDLPDIFQVVAFEIASDGLIAGPPN